MSNFVNELRSEYGNTISAADVKAFARGKNVSYPTVTRQLEQFKVKRGTWDLTVKEVREVLESSVSIGVTAQEEQSFVPDSDGNFVPFGSFSDVKKVIKSKQFYPIFITGLSGNGKTVSVEQACAQSNRELIRVNITIETDEDDLIGGFRLVNGETVWHNGPVVEALQRGAVLLLDEVDLASNKILCLQSILEGKGVFLKKIGKYVRPEVGFNVIATANTKGKGSDDGRFIGTNVLNEAFLERFPVTLEQEYPSTSIEQKILDKISSDTEFNKHLCDWADIIRKTFFDGGIDEVISTRRLVHIVKAYSIFGSKEKAISYCISRFDLETKQAFTELYDKVDAGVNFDEADDSTIVDTLQANRI